MLISNMIKKEMRGMDVSVLMGANVANEVARDEFGAELLDGGPWMQFKNPNTGKNIVSRTPLLTRCFSRFCCALPSTM